MAGIVAGQMAGAAACGFCGHPEGYHINPDGTPGNCIHPSCTAHAMNSETPFYPTAPQQERGG